MKTKTVTCISIRQPFATWTITPDRKMRKWCENRTWRTSYRGTIYIHASRWEPGCREHETVSPSPIGYPTGAIIGRVTLRDIVTAETLWEAEKALQAGREPSLWLPEPDVTLESWDDVNGPLCWLFGEPEPLREPVEAKGKLNLWKFELPE